MKVELEEREEKGRLNETYRREMEVYRGGRLAKQKLDTSRAHIYLQCWIKGCINSIETSQRNDVDYSTFLPMNQMFDDFF